MYEYVDDKQYLSRMRSLCGDIMQDLCHTLKEEYDIGSSFYLVGSGARNLILQNSNQPIDLDYNLEITRIDDWEDCRNIKECVRKAFNTVLREYGWSDCEDSTSSLTTEKCYISNGNDTGFSIDVCIVYEDVDGNYYRLIHEKRVLLIMIGIFGIKPLSRDALKKKLIISSVTENGHQSESNIKELRISI